MDIHLKKLLVVNSVEFGTHVMLRREDKEPNVVQWTMISIGTREPSNAGPALRTMAADDGSSFTIAMCLGATWCDYFDLKRVSSLLDDRASLLQKPPVREAKKFQFGNDSIFFHLGASFDT